MFRLQLLVFGIIILPALPAPSDVEHAMVISSTESSTTEDGKEGHDTYPMPTVPQIYEMRIWSNISNRFAHTVVVSKVRNFGNVAKEVSFSTLLAESAFISGFVMEVGGKNYTAYVKEKEEAKRIYDQAVASGLAAGHVALNPRDSKRFTVSVNIRPEEKAAFYLTYEQFLVRKNGLYEQIINIHPGQPVKNLGVQVVISESRKITNLKAPPLRSGSEIAIDKLELDPRANIEIVNENAATVTFNPNLERQKELAHSFGTKVENGLVGQFVIQYDVERDPQGGEVLVQNGYFVHFFAPTELQTLPKQIVFILDTSDSMRGQKLRQLKEAMSKILDQLNERDLFNLVDFNSNTRVWDLDDAAMSVCYPQRNVSCKSSSKETDTPNLQSIKFPKAYPVNRANIEKVRLAVKDLTADGSTSMSGALKVGLRLVETEKNHPRDSIERQPIIIFLTDGCPTDMNTSSIISQITEFNSELRRSAIFALAFGQNVEKTFLQTLAIRNSGYAKPIYVANDTSLQLQDFYQQIASPLLSNVTFKYEPSVTSLTKTEFPIHFGGTEIVVAGYCGTELPFPTIDSTSTGGRITLKPTVIRTVSNVERLWAYLTINQLLEKKDTSETENGTFKRKALELALKYSFVTPLSSLVVLKPNDTTSTVDTEQTKQVEHLSSHRRGSTQTYAISVIETRLNFLAYVLPWIREIVTDGFVKAPQGTYKLGANETIIDVVKCPKTPYNQEGKCKLLHLCPGAYPYLKTPLNFFDYFCVLKNEFAGICCP